MNRVKKKTAILCFAIALICLITFAAGFVKLIDLLSIKILVLVLLNLLNGFIAFIAMRLSGIKLEINIKNKMQYLIGVIIALSLSLIIGVIPALFGSSLVGNHMDFSWFNLIYYFLFYLFIIGPVEELVFRVYIQDSFINYFKNHKWIGVIITSFLFGLWHLINGSIIQVLFTFGIGLVFGFTKYKIKNCSYLSVALGHGLYDFLNIIVCMFII